MAMGFMEEPSKNRFSSERRIDDFGFRDERSVWARLKSGVSRLFGGERHNQAGKVFGRADAIKKREELRKALVAIRKGGFYTFEGLVSLARERFAKERDDLLKQANQKGLTHSERQQLRAKSADRAQDVGVLRAGYPTQRLAKELEKLCDQDDREYVPFPKGRRLRLMHDFFTTTGFLKNPVPTNLFMEKPHLVKGLVYKGAGQGDMLYHALRMSTGQGDPLHDYVLEERGTPKPFDGAVYRSFIFDNPYFKRGTFVVRNGDRRGPVEVEYFEGWDAAMPSHGSRLTQHYEEYYRGYMLDQGYDSYIFLFGPQEPSMKLLDKYSTEMAFKALDGLMKKWPRYWLDSGKDVTTFLCRLDEEKVLAFFREFLEGGESPSEDLPFETADPSKGTAVAPMMPKAMADFTGRGQFNTLMQKSLASGLPVARSERLRHVSDPKAEAVELKNSLWKLFGVNGKPAPELGKHLRIRTIYLEGANRADLTPNVLKGKLLAFDNVSKSEMLSERTIMYRLGSSIARSEDLAELTMEARRSCGRFDMRVEDESRTKLENFEPDYRQIFLDLGYDVAPVEEEHKAYRINPVVTDTGSDIEETEFIIE